MRFKTVFVLVLWHSKRYTSINQSIDRSIDQTGHSINQSIHNLLLIFMDSTNQAINQSTYQCRDISRGPNQSINRLTLISNWVFSLNCRGLQVLIVFCTVLNGEKSNGTVRWGRRCGEGVNWAWRLGISISVTKLLKNASIHCFLIVFLLSFP